MYVRRPAFAAFLLLLVLAASLSLAHDDGEPRDLSDVCSHPVEQLLSVNRPLKKYLRALLKTYYFQYIKLNLERECPFFKADPICTSEAECKASATSSMALGNFPLSWSLKESSRLDDSPNNNNLDFALFDKEERDPDALYYNLLENPERYTGYSGKDANKIWHAIYLENCHYIHGNEQNENPAPNPRLNVFDPPPKNMCLERTLFYRVISGMHTSVSVHLSYKYFNQTSGLFEPNLDSYLFRVGLFPERKANFYLAYIILFRAIQKISPLSFLSIDQNIEDEQKTRDIMQRISRLSLKCPNFFNEQLLFNTESNPDALLLKQSFREHFQNISSILDCIGCQRCRLWGKVQIIGLGTALKILFSFDDSDLLKHTLSRVELVALFNTIGKYSETMSYIQKFEEMHASNSMGVRAVEEEAANDYFSILLISIPLLVLASVGGCFYVRKRNARARENGEADSILPSSPIFAHNSNSNGPQKRLGRSMEHLVEE